MVIIRRQFADVCSEMFKMLKRNIKKSLDDPRYIPDYVKDVYSIVGDSDDIDWGYDFPTTILFWLVKKYNSEETKNNFSAHYDIREPYHNFLYTYFVRRCAMCHAATVLNEDDMGTLKKYCAIYKDFNNWRFDESAFRSHKVRDPVSFEEKNIDLNLDIIMALYNPLMLDIRTDSPNIFNFPECCPDFNELYTQGFYDPDYDLYIQIAREYVDRLNDPVTLKILYETFDVLDLQHAKAKITGGTIPFNYYMHSFENAVGTNIVKEF